MYKVIGCVVVWGFAVFGFSEWYSHTYGENENSKNNKQQV